MADTFQVSGQVDGALYKLTQFVKAKVATAGKDLDAADSEFLLKNYLPRVTTALLRRPYVLLTDDAI